MDWKAKYNFWKLKKGTNKKTNDKNLWSKKAMTLMTDTSEQVIAAILFQEGHSIMYLYRKLMSAKANDSNIEKEALEIVWSSE